MKKEINLGILIGYGDGIRNAEDVDVFDERPYLITNEENWGV